MITTAEEFIALRTSENPEEYHRAAHDSAEMLVWIDVINNYPEYKEWVVHNKTIQLEILQYLAKDNDPLVRAAVARKRKIDNTIFKLLSTDESVDVRYALMYNTKNTIERLQEIKTDDSIRLQEQLKNLMRYKNK